MTDKEKIKEQANIDISNLRIAQEQGIITEFGKGQLEALEGIVDFIDSLQEEPVNRTTADIEAAMQEVEEKSRAFTEAHKGESSDEILAQMRGEEPVNDGLLDTTQTITYNGEVYTRCYKDKLDSFACKYPMSVPKTSKRYAKYSDVDLTIAVKEGAQWQKNHLWKPADGDDLPEIDEEVIVLQGIKNPVTTDSMWGSEVAFAHRPNPNGWDGKSITTGKVEHYDVQTYDKGGWNIPDVKFWLDCELPKME